MKSIFTILVAIVMSSCNQQIILDKQVNVESDSLNSIESPIKEMANDTNSKATTLQLIKDNQTFAEYQGEIIISGVYRESNPESTMGGILCFDVDEKTDYLIPRDPNMWGPELGDNRSPWFCFKDQEAAKELFEINENEIFNNSMNEYSTCDIYGKASIIVSEYTVDKREIMTSDMASLVKIIEKSPFDIDCDKN